MTSLSSFLEVAARRSPRTLGGAEHSRATTCGLLLIALLSGLCFTGCTKSHASVADEQSVTAIDLAADRVARLEQPVAYSHKTHIEAGLECQRCHAGAFDNKRAGLPPLATCVSCHRRTIPDHPEVKILLDAWAAETPLQWVKVNVLPQQAMVQFHHGAHARAGVECATCHGDVATMTIAAPVVDVARMGWCVDCHRDNGASDDCLACHY